MKPMHIFFAFLPSVVMTTSRQSFSPFLLRREMIISFSFPHCHIILWFLFLWCKDSFDQTFITTNKAEFWEEKNCWTGNGHSGGWHPCGGYNNQGHGNYEQNKLGVTNTACLANNGGHCFDVIWMAFCGKYNTLSNTSNAHTTHHWFSWCCLFGWDQLPFS